MKNLVTEWNKNHKVGQDVTYNYFDTKKITKLTSKAWFLGGSMPVVKVECEDVCVSLDNVKANVPSDDCSL